MLASYYVNWLSGNFQNAQNACTIKEVTADTARDNSADDGTAK